LTAFVEKRSPGAGPFFSLGFTNLPIVKAAPTFLGNHSNLTQSIRASMFERPGFGLPGSAAVGISINANPTPSTWIGGGTSRIQNDTAGPLTIATTTGATLNAGIILSNGGTNPNFTVTGGGSVRLANTGNTANITASGGTILSNDLSTDLGAGAFGTVGTGSFALTNASFLLYDGPTATTAKPMTIANSSIGVVTVGANLTLSTAISESTPGSFSKRWVPHIPTTYSLAAR
jgi:hypothetical protein